MASLTGPDGWLNLAGLYWLKEGTNSFGAANPSWRLKARFEPYLAAALPGEDGTTILDFNKAYNPPCVFTEFATCPLATPRNRLPVAVEAGEKYTDEP
ncbi:MAG: DUF1684 domain-containing protein [Holophagales bacterium]|nr:DUF1684 domain-containing protein [Holophagales bacterium]MYD23473.1 DUF1684 domain-containing protein [Holophagales bacterium]MYI33051.1 DUF1684 domain-containing protein [Holophagales bacterium]